MLLAGEADRRAVGRRRRAATRSATSRSAGPSGTTSTATACAGSGRASRASCPSSRRASPGSSDLYQASGRRTYASVNFVTAHDGFTLADLVSYEHKHNEANGEDNRDGTDDNRSRNWGVEGPTDDPSRCSDAARAHAAQPARDAVLLAGRARCCSRGDELGRTQQRQQQRLLPGQRDLAGSTGISTPTTASCSSSRASCIAIFRDEPGASPPQLLHGPAGCGDGRQGRHVAAPDGTRDDRRATGTTPGPARARDADRRAGHRRGGRAGPAGVGETVLLLFNGGPSDALLHAARDGRAGRAGRCSSNTRAARARRVMRRAGRRTWCRTRCIARCSSPTSPPA